MEPGFWFQYFSVEYWPQSLQDSEQQRTDETFIEGNASEVCSQPVLVILFREACNEIYSSQLSIFHEACIAVVFDYKQDPYDLNTANDGHIAYDDNVDLEPANDEDIADDDDGVRQAGTEKPKENSNTLPT